MKLAVTKVHLLSYALLFVGSVSYASVADEAVKVVREGIEEAVKEAVIKDPIKPMIEAGATAVVEGVSGLTEGLEKTAVGALKAEKLSPMSRCVAAIRSVPATVQGSKAVAKISYNLQKARIWVMDNKGKAVLLAGGAALVVWVLWNWYKAEKENEEDFAHYPSIN